MVNKQFRRYARLAGYTAAGLMALLLLGASSQSFQQARDLSRFPAPGEFVTLDDGRRLHMRVMGEEHAGPTIVLELGGTLTTSAWAWLQPALAQHATVVAYDRANTAWSDPVDRIADASATVEDLYTALQRRDLQGPYILVGHSIGGHYVQQFAAAHPGETGGLVLLDPSPAGWAIDLPQEMVESIARQQGMTGLLRVATQLGLTRLYNPLSGIAAGLPEREKNALLAATMNSHHLAGMEHDTSLFLALGAASEEVGHFGAMPVRIVSAGISDDPAYEAWQAAQWAMHRKLLAISTNSEHIVMPSAAHITLVTEKIHALKVAEIILSLLPEIDTSTCEI